MSDQPQASTAYSDPNALVPARFTIYTIDGSFPGYHRRTRWNGWACPYFELETAREIMRKVNESDPEQTWWETDDAILTQHDCDPDDEPTAFHKENHLIDGQTLTLVPVGAFHWVWELVE